MAQPQLNQVIAAEAGVRKRQEDAITATYKDIQKGSTFDGMHRSYAPLDAEGDTLPTEEQIVQNTVPLKLSEVAEVMGSLMDTVATKDWGNTQARADVVLEDGTMLIPAAPVTYLLFLERQLNDLRTIIGKLPTLDPSVEWTASTEAPGIWKTRAFKANRTAKVLQNHVKAPATDKHPAQVETYTVDKVIGEYDTTRSSGAIPGTERAAMLRRVEAVIKAVKQARELANSQVVEPQNGISDAMLDYVTGVTE